jgi:hypothetical protein
MEMYHPMAPGPVQVRVAEQVVPTGYTEGYVAARPGRPWAIGRSEHDHGCDSCRQVVEAAHLSRQLRDILWSRREELAPETPDRLCRPRRPDEAERTYQASLATSIFTAVTIDIFFAAFMIVMVASWVPDRLRETWIYILAPIYLVCFFVQWNGDVGPGEARPMDAYQSRLSEYTASVAEYQRRREEQLPAIEAELATAERELARLDQQAAAHDRRQRRAMRGASP